MAAAVLFGAASCAKEDISSSLAGGEVEVTFTANLPELGTRAYGDGKSATNLQYYVYEQNTDGTLTPLPQLCEVNGVGISGSATVNLALIKGMTYTITFWAANNNAEPYHFNGKEVNITYPVAANAESLDAFYGVVTNFNPATATNDDTKVDLVRPFAQLNAITTDCQNVKLSGITEILQSSIKVKRGQLNNTFNLLTGVASCTCDPSVAEEWVSFTTADIPAESNIIGDTTTNMHLAMNYLLVNGEKSLIDVEFSFIGKHNGANFPFTAVALSNIPVQRNYKTNIIGSLLTKSTDFQVTIDANWATTEKYVLAGGEVTLTENLVANNIVVKEDTVLNLNGYNVESGIEYVAGLTGTDIAAITIENGATLTIKGEGTIKGTSYGVYAKDGNLIIEGGNYTAETSAVQVSNAKVEIKAGTFAVTGDDKRYVINCLDADYKAGRAVVEITGGTFEAFNPANNAAEGQGTNFVVNGYCALESNGSFTVSKGYPIYSDNAETTIVEGVVGLEIDAENNITTYGVSSANGLKWISEQIDSDLTRTAEKAYEVNGNTIKLLADIDLSESNWNPIGDNRTDAAFTGVFDGQNHKITGAHITGSHCFNGTVWGLKEGWGLFSKVKGATIKNVKVDGATFGSYTVITGTIAAYAHNTTFENIEITNTKIAGYDWYTGGVVGWASGNCTFKGINLDNTVAVGSLWDSHGQMAGGIAGGVSASSKITIEDCNIACVLDVINDVTSNYKWYNYRVSGMIIGTTNTTEGKWMETVTASATNVTCKNVTVTYGKWMNYHYCEEYGNRGWGRVEESDYVGFGIPNEHTHSDGKEHYVCLPFDQLFGGGNNTDGRYPVRGLAEFPGVTVVYPAEYTCELCGQQHNVAQ